MNIGFCSLASGSSGNCYLIKSEKTNLLLDAGISLKAIKSGLQTLGVDLDEIDAILITHEHIDHIKGLKALSRKTDCPIITSIGTWDALTKKGYELPTFRSLTVDNDDAMEIGDITVKPFRLSHDTEDPMSFSFEKNGHKICIVTDTGYVSSEVYENIKDAEMLALEANHERNILLYGSYPYPLKLRILSDLGHLSNESCAEVLKEILKEGFRPQVFLAHLSKENNTPEQALITVKNIIEEEGFLVGRDLGLKVLEREVRSEFFTI